MGQKFVCEQYPLGRLLADLHAQRVAKVSRCRPDCPRADLHAMNEAKVSGCQRDCLRANSEAKS